MITVQKPNKITDLKWLNLFTVDYTTANGKQGVWTFASRKKEPQINQPLVADAVVIIPLLKDGRKKRLVTIKEFRIPLGDYEYGFPAGLYDHNETAEDVAKRELKEETGLDVTNVLYVGPACVSSAGLSDESVVYVVCECTGKINTNGNEDSEDIIVSDLTLEGIRILCNAALRSAQPGNRQINISAKALPFMLMFDCMNKIAWPKHMIQKRITDKPKNLLSMDEAGYAFPPITDSVS